MGPCSMSQNKINATCCRAASRTDLILQTGLIQLPLFHVWFAARTRRDRFPDKPGQDDNGHDIR